MLDDASIISAIRRPGKCHVLVRQRRSRGPPARPRRRADRRGTARGRRGGRERGPRRRRPNRARPAAPPHGLRPAFRLAHRAQDEHAERQTDERDERDHGRVAMREQQIGRAQVAPVDDRAPERGGDAAQRDHVALPALRAEPPPAAGAGVSSPTSARIDQPLQQPHASA